MTIKARFLIKRGDFILNADFTCPSHGVSAIFGPSGSGKTTLLRAIAGLERTDNSCLDIVGTIWQDKDKFIPPHRRPLGYVFQEANLFPHLSVQENLEYGFKRIPEKEREVDFAVAVKMLGVEPLLKRYPAALSGGERQRAAIARALLTSPKLLLMDEPLASLDAKSKAEILPYLECLHEDLAIPVIYVSHSQDEVARLADYLLLMENGRIIASGPLDAMLTRTDLPLVHGNDASSIIEAEVISHDREYHLTNLKFSGGIFSISHKELPVGQKVRLKILVRDVSITTEKQVNTSILNIFPAVIEEIAYEEPAQAIIRLNMGGIFILSRIMQKSAQLLNLKQGSNVFAQVKSVAIT